MQYVYAIAGEKGGLGKTSVAVNLAVAFHRAGLRALLIDLDAQAHATHWLGIGARKGDSEASFLGVVHGRALRSLIRPTAEGVDVLPAHPVMAALPVHLAATPNSGIFLLQDALKAAACDTPPYDVTILDLAPARGPVLATALAAATRCISPLQPEELVFQALYALIESVTQAQRLNPRLRGLNLLRNRYAVRSTGDHAYDAMLRQHYATILLETIIPIRAALRDSAGFQQSIFAYNGGDATEVRSIFLTLVDELVTLDEIA